MTRIALQVSAAAFAVAAVTSLSPALADTSGASSATPSASSAAPSQAAPAPTPSHGGAAASRHHPNAHWRHAAHRHWRHTSYPSNPASAAATGIAHGVADLGAIAAYPVYCFPNYGSCSMRLPYP